MEYAWRVPLEGYAKRWGTRQTDFLILLRHLLPFTIHKDRSPGPEDHNDALFINIQSKQTHTRIAVEWVGWVEWGATRWTRVTYVKQDWLWIWFTLSAPRVDLPIQTCRPHYQWSSYCACCATQWAERCIESGGFIGEHTRIWYCGWYSLWYSSGSIEMVPSSIKTLDSRDGSVHSAHHADPRVSMKGAV